MITKLNVATIWVKDQDEALRFYTEKLGFAVRTDYSAGDYRWLTVGLDSQPDLEYHLEALKPSHAYSQEEVDALTKLVEAGKLGPGPWQTEDVRGTYETLVARGVEFVQPPTDREYGSIEAILKDPSGNLLVLTQNNY